MQESRIPPSPDEFYTISSSKCHSTHVTHALTIRGNAATVAALYREVELSGSSDSDEILELIANYDINHMCGADDGRPKSSALGRH